MCLWSYCVRHWRGRTSCKVGSPDMWRVFGGWRGEGEARKVGNQIKTVRGWLPGQFFKIRHEYKGKSACISKGEGCLGVEVEVEVDDSWPRGADIGPTLNPLARGMGIGLSSSSGTIYPEAGASIAIQQHSRDANVVFPFL
jgi:hypothetical protein